MGRPALLTAAVLEFATPRCRVDRVAAADAEAVRALFLDPAVRRHLGGPVSRERAAAVAQACRHDDDTGGARAVRLLGDAAAIGLVFLGPHHDGRDVEVSYMLTPARWGRGLMTEVLRALLDRIGPEVGLDRVVAETQEANLPSRRLLERVGMTPERRVVRFGAAQVIYAARLGRS